MFPSAVFHRYVCKKIVVKELFCFGLKNLRLIRQSQVMFYYWSVSTLEHNPAPFAYLYEPCLSCPPAVFVRNLSVTHRGLDTVK